MIGLDFSQLSTGLSILFIACIVLVFAFEFVNGFHDTANAVATVIYTKSLKPQYAVVWSGLLNFCGVLLSARFGLEVAMKVANLLPIDALMGKDSGHAVAMVVSILLSAIIWNLGTWYLGIPCSSSHTLFGSIIGAGLIFSWMPENTAHVKVPWEKAYEIGQALLFSPAFGFTMAVLLMFVLRNTIKNKELFKEPVEGARPPMWVRFILICTCGLVSILHGSNDGQKGIGLLLIILMTFQPLQFALSPEYNPTEMAKSLTLIEQSLPIKDMGENLAPKELALAASAIEELKKDIATNAADMRSRLSIRKRINILEKNIKALMSEASVIREDAARATIKAELPKLHKLTHYAPLWTVVLISVALGLGTMIGWKRIVVTIGEKIGKRHMTYAEGATAELITAATIGAATYLGGPVSTTHILSSGVAGAMVASKGTKNLQKGTIYNIALAWILTLPATVIIAGGLYLIFRNFA
jgi:phosphate/sulfate permease